MRSTDSILSGVDGDVEVGDGARITMQDDRDAAKHDVADALMFEPS
jgi:hypothetical protein